MHLVSPKWAVMDQSRGLAIVAQRSRLPRAVTCSRWEKGIEEMWFPARRHSPWTFSFIFLAHALLPSILSINPSSCLLYPHSMLPLRIFYSTLTTTSSSALSLHLSNLLPPSLCLCAFDDFTCVPPSPSFPLFLFSIHVSTTFTYYSSHLRLSILCYYCYSY